MMKVSSAHTVNHIDKVHLHTNYLQIKTCFEVYEVSKCLSHVTHLYSKDVHPAIIIFLQLISCTAINYGQLLHFKTEGQDVMTVT